jgi:hypothetical protein
VTLRFRAVTGSAGRNIGFCDSVLKDFFPLGRQCEIKIEINPTVDKTAS